MGSSRRSRRVRHERQVVMRVLWAGLPAVLVMLWLLWMEPHSLRTRLTFTLLAGGAWLLGAIALRERVARPLQTLSNLIAAVREGDYGVRARSAHSDDALGVALLEINALADTLRDDRLHGVEADALLRRVTEEVDVAIFTFDADNTLRLVNRAGERVLTRPASALLGHSASELGLAECLIGETPRTVDILLPEAAGRWELRRRTFRQDGKPHELVVLTDVSRVLRAEERVAWRRLVRVLGHEINNSLAPIKSIGASLHKLIDNTDRPGDWEKDLRDGLAVITSRAESLARFMGTYARLARLPSPSVAPLSVGDWVRRVAALETRLPVRVIQGPAVTVLADGDQLDQMLINLVRNGVDAAIESNGGVELTWVLNATTVEILVSDEGPGLPGATNLFVPFFTTKPGGSGIGLLLSRQIAEAHGGSITLEPREPGPGARARVRLPLIGGRRVPAAG